MSPLCAAILECILEKGNVYVNRSTLPMVYDVMEHRLVVHLSNSIDRSTAIDCIYEYQLLSLLSKAVAALHVRQEAQEPPKLGSS